MTIPRPFKIEMLDFCFALKLSNCDAIYKVPLSLLLASLFIIADTTLWVICTFATAGPMIFSGIVEGAIYYVVVTRLFSKNEAGRLTLRLSRSGRKNLLVSIVSGNLVMTHNDPRGLLTDELSIPEDSHDAAPSNEAGLISMMRTQQSFGAIVGAPVIFFIGSFIYNVIDLASKTGDNNVSTPLFFPTSTSESSIALALTLEVRSHSCFWNLVDGYSSCRNCQWLSPCKQQSGDCWRNCQKASDFRSSIRMAALGSSLRQFVPSRMDAR